MKKLRLNEQQFLKAVRLLSEDKRTDTARALSLQFLRDYFASWPMFQQRGHRLDDIFYHDDNPRRLTYIDYMFNCFEEVFFHDPKLRASQIMRLEPSFIKMAFDAGFQQGCNNSKILNKVRKIIWKMYYLTKDPDPKTAKEYQKRIQNLDSTKTTFEEVNETFGVLVDQDDAAEEERINTKQYIKNADYKIVGPIDFKIAKKFGQFTGKPKESYLNNDRDKEIYEKKRAKAEEQGKEFPSFEEWAEIQAESTKMCYSMFPGTWEDYADADLSRGMQKNTVYIALRKDWMDIPPVHDDGGYSAYDTYGLSMIWIIVDDEGGLQYCNTRWNHAADYKEGRSVDFALSREEISDIVGRNFMRRFVPADVEMSEDDFDFGNTEEDNEEDRGEINSTTDPQVKEECYNVFRDYFGRRMPGFNLDAEFVDAVNNPRHLSNIDYMFYQFETTFYENEELKNSEFGKYSEPIFLRIALENGFQQTNTPDLDKFNRISMFISYLYHLSISESEESELAFNLPNGVTLGYLERNFGDVVDSEEW